MPVMPKVPWVPSAPVVSCATSALLPAAVKLLWPIGQASRPVAGSTVPARLFDKGMLNMS